MSEPLRVCHLVLSLDCGGLERIVVDLIGEGRRLGHQVEVVCLERPGTLAPAAERLGARVHSCDKPPGLRWSMVKRLRGLWNDLRPQVIHSHQIGALFYGGTAARRIRDIAIVHTEHGKHLGERWRTRLLARLAGRHAARFVCVSKDIAQEVRSRRIVPERKLLIVPNGIDAVRFRLSSPGAALEDNDFRHSLGIPASAPVIGTVGRLSPVKRQDVLIRAFGQIRQPAVEPHLLLVGAGPSEPDLKHLATELGLAARVHFAGYQAEPERYLRRMSIFALTSDSEGMPVAVLEAWAAGLPVVATRVGGVPELIVDGETGLLAPQGNDASLARAFDRLLADPASARRMGEAGRQEVEARHSLGRMAETYHDLYLQVLAEKDQA